MHRDFYTISPVQTSPSVNSGKTIAQEFLHSPVLQSVFVSAMFGYGLSDL